MTPAEKSALRPSTETRSGTCSHCGAAILWRQVTAKGRDCGRWEPVNPDETGHHTTCPSALALVAALTKGNPSLRAADRGRVRRGRGREKRL